MARANNSLPAFLLALRQSIVDANIVPAIACRISTEERTLEYAQSQYIVMVIPGALVPEDQGGEGQEETIFRGGIIFRLLCQAALDTPTGDVVALTDQNTTTGIYVLFQQLLQVIRFWDYCDPAGNGYLVQPMRMGTVTQPRRNSEHSQYIQMDVPAEFKICIGKGVSGQ